MEISPEPESLFPVSTKNIRSQRLDFNHRKLFSENFFLIVLSFCNKTSWFIVSNAFWRSTIIIPVNKPSSTPFNILSVKFDKHRFAEWFGLNPD